MTLRQLRSRCRYWMKRLELGEWTDIKLRWATKEEAREVLGACSWNMEERTAEIWISRSAPLEATLVHELLHLVLDGHKPMDSYRYNPPMERAINRISAALMEAI